MRGLFGEVKNYQVTTDIVKTENKYISEFENIFLKPSMTVFDENGHLKNLNEEFIRQELAGTEANHFVVKEFMTVGSEPAVIQNAAKEVSHEKLATKFNKQIFKTVMTASIAQSRIGSMFDRINLLPDFLPQPQPVLIPTNPGISLNGGSADDESLIHRSDRNILMNQKQ